MPKLCLVHAAQAYIMQPEIHIGYNQKKGGWGTVIAKMMEDAMLSAQAKSSIKNLKGCVRKSSRIHSTIPANILFIQLLTGQVFAFGFDLDVKVGCKGQCPVVHSPVPTEVRMCT
jgi:hypothetical protein